MSETLRFRGAFVMSNYPTHPGGRDVSINGHAVDDATFQRVMAGLDDVLRTSGWA